MRLKLRLETCKHVQTETLYPHALRGGSAVYGVEVCYDCGSTRLVSDKRGLYPSWLAPHIWRKPEKGERRAL